jgi:mono/diheme cytochrome c family protein
MKSKILRALLTAAIFLAALLMCMTIASAQTGESTFKTKCAACHGADGKGATAVGKSLKIRDLSSPDVQKQSDADLTAIIANGKGSLSGDQIKQLVGYIRQLAKA